MFEGGGQMFGVDWGFCLSRFHVAADFGLKKINHWENLQSPHCKKIPSDDSDRGQGKACMEGEESQLLPARPLPSGTLLPSGWRKGFEKDM